MTDETPLDAAEFSPRQSDGQVTNRAPRLTGLVALVCYLLMPVAGVFGWAVALLVAALISQLADSFIVATDDLRAAFARGGLGIATRTIIRELAILLLVFTEPWDTRGGMRVAAVLLLSVAAVRTFYLLTLVLVRRRAVLPVETRNIDLSGIAAPPPLPLYMTRRLSERFHGLSAVALAGAAIAIVTRHPVILFVVVGLVLAAEVVASGAAVLTLLRSRGKAVREHYLAAVHGKVTAARPEVMIYHSGTIDSGHQVNMWLGAMERLERPVLIALRERTGLEELARTKLPVICIPDPVDYMAFVLPSVRVALYTANVGKVIHMLREPGVQHVFIGHGDSDKTASFNPFSRVYSEVWVAGAAGRDRYRRAGVGVRDEDIVEVGRPQLDGISVVSDRIGDRAMTVLYAPTWEGWTGDPAHTSLIRTGPALIERLVSLDGVQVIYKPHPFTGTVSQEAARADARIRSTIARAGAGNITVGGGTGAVTSDGPEPTLYDCFNRADLMVADISSVLTDFVYSGKPYVVTNLTELGDEAFQAQFPSAGQAYVLDAAADRIGSILDLVRDTDPLAAGRLELKRYLLGPDKPDAMTRFAAAADAAYNKAVALSPVRVAAGRED